ncbi:MAG: permease-like cell division protein FtsX [Halieaceae bacterium]|nr:permease-like cell division protein FtsX [Halieaceae bacterium]
MQRVLDNPVSSAMTWLVIGIALALPSGLNVALDNISQLSASWDSPAQISLFLHDEVSDQRARELQSELSARADVSVSRFVSREEALEEFRSLSGFADVLSSLQANPLPHLIVVAPTQDSDQLAAAGLRAELEAYPDVAQAVLDMEWLQRLNSLMMLGRRLVWAVAGLLILGVLLILGNTIRLAIESRREEIVIVKLVGGSNAFVRRPFLYTGLWYGVGGGLFAGLLVGASLWFLQDTVAELARLYQSDFRLRGLGIMGGLNLIILGGMLGLAGAWLAVSRHLADIQPR